jgi:hypothetical protein
VACALGRYDQELVAEQEACDAASAPAKASDRVT